VWTSQHLSFSCVRSHTPWQISDTYRIVLHGVKERVWVSIAESLLGNLECCERCIVVMMVAEDAIVMVVD
jgi:hypothetical protein